ncbi:MAG: primosomal protein N' [Dehalococcoidia bacterium]|nr:primosomal protein N' [Dehalococcoidia bacterium]
MKYAEVAVNSPGARRTTFSYAIPDNIVVSPGQAVWVPFGPTTTQGIVIALSDAPSVTSVREISGTIGDGPILSPIQLKLADWICDYYLCPLFEAIALMLPPGFEQHLSTVLVLSRSMSDEDGLSPEQQRALSLMQKKRRITMKELQTVLGQKRARIVADQLCRRGLTSKVYELEPPKVRPKTATYVRMAVDKETAASEIERRRQTAPKQASVLSYLIPHSTPLLLSSVLRNTGSSREAILRLVQQGLLSIEKRPIRRDPLADFRYQPAPSPDLTPAQQTAVDSVLTKVKSQTAVPPVFLLHGVTGSGKTEVYLRLLQEIVRLGKRGICLVPEIALTPQTIERFYARFPGRIAVMHSGLSLGEQYDEWYRIKNGDCDVVIGPRGALFVPQPDLGLIIIDEEHEWTYKQVDRSPRYHARETAIKLAELTGALVVLGTATPDVETYFKAQQGQYYLISLPERVSPHGPRPLPHVDIIDMRQELKAGNTSIFSRALVSQIDEAISRKQQVILFLNRRGTATLVKCRDCSYVCRCPKCSVTLTYHAPLSKLVCHRCHYAMTVPYACPQCLRPRLQFMGIGTQTVETEVKRLFPEVKTVRWDSDTTMRRHSHELILADFRDHRTDILIGTQMVAKGLDLPDVTLAGIVNADIGLNVPDFRASERTFQLLSQVAGRAGRGFWPGRVIVQTYCPEHYAIKLAAAHDYHTFYTQELEYRRQFGYPPFSKLVRLVYSHTNATACQTEVERLSRLLNTERYRLGLADINILGPSPAPVARLRGRYRWQLAIRGKRPESILTNITLPSGWTVDVDPIGVI